MMFVFTNLQASELTRYFNNLTSLNATFTQTVFASSNTPKQKSSGLIIAKSPNKFYLEYKTPYKIVYVANGKKLWSYDEDLEQVVVKKQGDMLVNTPAMLLSNPKSLTKQYKIERTGEDDGWIWFELTPKLQNSNFESVSLAFDNNELMAMEMRDNFGQTTRLKFNRVEKNPEISNSHFNFKPPAGIDIIGK